MGDDDRGPRNPLGPVGRTVIENIRQLRQARGLSYARLSAKLAELDRPIAVLGLRRIENGKRRVDADDLVALALALNVTPPALLLPRSVAAGDEQVALTPAVACTAEDAWLWAGGQWQLRDHDLDDFLLHARPEYQVRAEVDRYDAMAREAREDAAIAKALPGAAALAEKTRDDLDRRARALLPGYATEQHVAAYNAWPGRAREEHDGSPSRGGILRRSIEDLGPEQTGNN
jgi:transcriptional regulator with XRE-family HTH domain